MNLIWSDISWDEYLAWQQQDKKTLKKINELLKDIKRNGSIEGIGKPEKLKYRDAYSRRIDSANRLVYNVDSDNILIYSCKGHYED